MKKLFKYAALVLTASAIAACTPSQTSQKNAAGNDKVQIKIKNGTYVIPSDSSSDSKYLALNVEIKNKSNKSLSVSNSDVTLYNSDDEKIKAENIYDSEGDFQTMSVESVSKGKSVSGYLVFEVDKDEKYELHYAPAYSTSKDDQDIEIKVDASKYSDDTEKMQDLAREYVEGVFLNGEDSANASNVSATSGSTEITSLTSKNAKDSSSSSSSDKNSSSKSDKKNGLTLGNDIEKDRSEFTKAFVESFKNDFSYYDPSDDELKTFLTAYTKANAKRAKITFKVKSYLPESAEVYVRPEVIDLANLNSSELLSKFVSEHQGQYSSYSEARKAAEKYFLEQMPTQFDSTPLDTSDSMNKDGFVLKMTKKNGKWTVDTSDYNYESLSQAFYGDL